MLRITAMANLRRRRRRTNTKRKNHTKIIRRVVPKCVLPVKVGVEAIRDRGGEITQPRQLNPIKRRVVALSNRRRRNIFPTRKEEQQNQEVVAAANTRKGGTNPPSPNRPPLITKTPPLRTVVPTTLPLPNRTSSKKPTRNFPAPSTMQRTTHGARFKAVPIRAPCPTLGICSAMMALLVRAGWTAPTMRLAMPSSRDPMHSTEKSPRGTWSPV
mmetsp:Transcript_35189/g.74239  ORF Transcript_35189/g.74239 Transcript_35189/m.74239 type:complete len:214 (-) Transcript_35189:2067-2708(-)